MNDYSVMSVYLKVLNIYLNKIFTLHLIEGCSDSVCTMMQLIDSSRLCGWAMSELGMGFGESYHPNVNDFAPYKWFLLYYFFQVLVYVLMCSP